MREGGRPRGDRTRRRILDATLDVIVEDGVRAVTQRRISAAADASVGLISYHFTSTRSLIAAALQQLAEQETRRLVEARERIDALEGDLAGLTDLLVAEVTRSGTAQRRDVIAAFALTLEIPRGTIDPMAFDAWEEAQLRYFQAIGTAAGAHDPVAVGEFLLGSTDGLAFYHALHRTPEGMVRAARAGFEHLLNGLTSGRSVAR